MKRVVKVLLALSIGLLVCLMSSCQGGLVNKNSADTNVAESANGKKDASELESEILETIGESVIREVREVREPMEILDIAGYRDTDKSTYIEIKFSKEIQDKFDASSYIKIEPNVAFTVSKVESKLLLRGDFNPLETYKVTVLSGIKAFDGVSTLKETAEVIAFDQKKPKIAFTNEGIILPSVNEKRIYIRSLNVKKINVVVRKVYANNMTQFLQNFNFTGNGYYSNDNYYDSEYYDEEDEYGYDRYVSAFDNVGDKLYDVNFDIENEIDTWVQTSLDLSGVLDNNGIYQVFVKFDENGTSYKFTRNENGKISWDDREYLRDNGRIVKNILLTDIGILAQKGDEGLRVNVLDIVDNRLMRGAKVYLMSRNNQILEEKTTDADGIVTFSHHKNSFYILVDNVQSRSILPLKNELNTNGFSVDGAYASNGIRGFIYTERGVYRPGDPVYVSIIARNNEDELEDKQPVKITIYDPTGVKMIENDVIGNGKKGFYTYTFKTDIQSKTGIWKLEATIGDQTFKKDISVETVVPNKIKVNLNIPEVVDYDGNISGWSINSNYLFGEPAGNLQYGVSFDIREEPVVFEKYKDYAFTVPSSYGYSDNKFLEGKLDKDGFADLTPDFSDVSFGSLNMLMDVSGRVTEDGGRNVLAKKYIKLKKYDTYVGIENSSTYKRPGESINLKAICVTEDGETLVPGKTLKYRIYSNDHYWWWDYSDYNDFVRSFKSDKNTTLIYEGAFVTEDVPSLIDYTVPNVEYLYVEVEDETTGQVTGVNLQSSEWVDPSVTKKVETLNLSLDKKKYFVGDTAQVKYKGSKGSKAIITIEKAGKILNQYFKDANDTEMIEQVAITKEMAPNAYIYVMLLQDYKTKENDRPLRLYGIVPLNVEDEDTKIDMEIEAPEQIRPNEKFTVKVKNRKFKEVNFTIAVVDEGLLDITAFKTPNPWTYFFQKLAAKLSLYDNYSQIIDRPYGAVHQILKVGGDEALLDEAARKRRLKELGLEDADRFKPVSMFKGVLTTDASGTASVDFEMPNYMGQVRIMVVAADGNSYGSAEKDMIVKAPIIVQPTLPRSMKIGDKMSIPVSVFALEEGLGNVEVYYTFKGKTQTKNLMMSKGEKQIVYFDESIDNEIGNEKLTVGVHSNIYNYEETVGMAINSNNTPIEVSENSELKGKEVATYNQDLEYVKGTVDSTLTISNKMMLGLDQRLRYLIRYPYGCAEQTTSSVFPQLFIDKLSTTKNYDKQKVVDNINAGISRLKLFQLSSGAFSYWPGDKDKSDWATNYVGHFLIYAKKNGYYLPDSMYDKWINYTAKTVRGTKLKSEYDISWKTYALYLLALAGKQNISEMNYMYENYYVSKMNDTSRMYLAAAYKLIGEDNVATSIASSINTKSITKSFDELYARDRYYYSYSYGSLLRELAVYLDCYYTIYGKRDQEAFDEILSAMRSKGWYSTQTTAYSLLALSNIASENVSDTIKGVIDIDGVQTEYTTSDVYKVNIKEGAKSVKVIPDTDAMTYVNYYWEGVPINSDIKDYSEGFSIERDYYNDEGKVISASNVKSGNTFWMEVTVKPTKRNMDRIENIAINQILPSGWEIENLRVTDSRAPKWIEEKSNGTDVSYTDIRDDRVMWFFNYNNEKELHFFVKINAVTKGDYDLPGTVLEAMYDNNYRAFKKGVRVTVS